MDANLAHAAIAVAMLAAPASLGVAAHEDVALPGLSADEAQARDGETLETFEGGVPEEVTAGELDLRIDRGAVRVVGWDQPRYRIEVLQEATDGDAGQRETTAAFDESVDGDTIALEVVVDREGSSLPSVRAGSQTAGAEDPDRAIVAHVPERLTYESVHACEGQSFQGPNLTEPLISWGNEECVASDDAIHGSWSVHVDARGEDGLDVSWGLEGVDGREALLEVDDGHVEFNDTEFTKLEARTDNGPIEGSAAAETVALATDNGDVDLDLEASEARVLTDDGEIELDGPIEALDADTDNGGVDVESDVLSEGSIVTDNGPIEVNVLPARSGQLTLETDNGPIDVYLGHEDDVGYLAHGVADSGRVQIALVDETNPREENVTADERDHGDQEVAKTQAYERLPVQLEIDASTDNGAIEIVEDTADLENEDAEAESSTTLSRLR